MLTKKGCIFNLSPLKPSTASSAISSQSQQHAGPCLVSLSPYWDRIRGYACSLMRSLQRSGYCKSSVESSVWRGRGCYATLQRNGPDQRVTEKPSYRETRQNMSSRTVRRCEVKAVKKIIINRIPFHIPCHRAIWRGWRCGAPVQGLNNNTHATKCSF